MCHCLLVFLEKKLLAFLDLATIDKEVVGQGFIAHLLYSRYIALWLNWSWCDDCVQRGIGKSIQKYFWPK